MTALQEARRQLADRGNVRDAATFTCYLVAFAAYVTGLRIAQR